MHDYGSMGCDEGGGSGPVKGWEAVKLLTFYCAILVLFFGGLWAITH